VERLYDCGGLITVESCIEGTELMYVDV